MKRLLGLTILLMIPALGWAQFATYPISQTTYFTSSLNTNGGTVIDTTVAPARGIINHKFSWTVLGTVSAGAIKLQKSVDKTNWTDCIAAQTVTSAGGPTSITSCVSPYLRLFPSTAITGTGTVVVTYTGYVDAPAVSSSLGTVGIDQITAHANEVVCISGCSGGTTDTDDASIAAGQATGLSLALSQVYDGTVWRRFTIGTAGTASAQVVTVQGVASMTPILATLSGTNTVTTVSTVTSLSQFAGAAINLGSGAASTGTLRMIAATDSPEVTVLGATGDAAASAGGTGSISAKLREISTQLNGTLTVSGGAADGATFTAGSSVETPAGGLYEASPTTCTTGKTCAVGLTTNREFKVDLTTAAMTAATTPFAVRASDGTNFISDAAVGAAISSNPVPSGCEFETSPTTISSGQAGVIHCTAGQLAMVTLFNGTNQMPAMDAIARRGYIELSDGTNGQAVDPCQDAALTKTNINVRIAGTSLTQLVAAQSSKTTYICWLKIEADGTSEIASVIEAAHTSTACDGSQTALEGNTTAANGIALGANGGFIAGNGGYAVYKTSATAHEICGLDSGSNPVHYTGQWVAR